MPDNDEPYLTDEELEQYIAELDAKLSRTGLAVFATVIVGTLACIYAVYFM